LVFQVSGCDLDPVIVLDAGAQIRSEEQFWPEIINVNQRRREDNLGFASGDRASDTGAG
jgi:hypothetical protein